MRRTVKLKLDLKEEERKTLEKTIKKFKKACQSVVESGWKEEGLKTYHKNKLHKKTYTQIREETDYPPI